MFPHSFREHSSEKFLGISPSEKFKLRRRSSADATSSYPQQQLSFILSNNESNNNRINNNNNNNNNEMNNKSNHGGGMLPPLPGHDKTGIASNVPLLSSNSDLQLSKKTYSSPNTLERIKSDPPVDQSEYHSLHQNNRIRTNTNTNEDSPPQSFKNSRKTKSSVNILKKAFGVKSDNEKEKKKDDDHHHHQHPSQSDILEVNSMTTSTSNQEFSVKQSKLTSWGKKAGLEFLDVMRGKKNTDDFSSDVSNVFSKKSKDGNNSSSNSSDQSSSNNSTRKGLPKFSPNASNSASSSSSIGHIMENNNMTGTARHGDFKRTSSEITAPITSFLASLKDPLIRSVSSRSITQNPHSDIQNGSFSKSDLNKRTESAISIRLSTSVAFSGAEFVDAGDNNSLSTKKSSTTTTIPTSTITAPAISSSITPVQSISGRRSSERDIMNSFKDTRPTANIDSRSNSFNNNEVLSTNLSKSIIADRQLKDSIKMSSSSSSSSASPKSGLLLSTSKSPKNGSLLDKVPVDLSTTPTESGNKKELGLLKVNQIYDEYKSIVGLCGNIESVFMHSNIFVSDFIFLIIFFFFFYPIQ